MFGELVGARAASEAEKRVDGVSPGRPQSFRYQRRPVEDCSTGRTKERIAQSKRVRARPLAEVN